MWTIITIIFLFYIATALMGLLAKFFGFIFPYIFIVMICIAILPVLPIFMTCMTRKTHPKYTKYGIVLSVVWVSLICLFIFV